MKRILLQKPSGEPRGWIEFGSYGRKQICLPCGKPLGFYLPKPDTTHSMSGTLIGRGDLLTSLL
jgi:hypothetical protein